ncbi:MAG TPA: lysoplasmalogenase family protein, partial [Actinomycetota bacterium]|nr:lysoplasmalogenase family protein [Actinomycetota bacterium]
AVAAAAVAAPVYLRLLRGMVSSGAARRMAVPVGLYVVAVAGMAASALATLATPGWTGTRSALAIAGAVLFMGSDALIGWNRFVRPLPWAPVAIMASYHLAQGALVWALLGAV